MMMATWGIKSLIQCLVFTCVSLSFETDSQKGAISCPCQAGCLSLCVTKIYLGGMSFGKREWELMSLATMEGAHGEGLLISSFSTIHLQSTSLSAFFSTDNLRLPCYICSKPMCYDYKTLPRPFGSQR